MLGVAVTGLDAAPQTEPWYAARRAGIGASDIPAILGLSKYRTALEVYHDKRGDLPPDPGHESARWGTLLEDTIAQEWAQRHDTTVERVPTLAHPQHPWRMASLDRLVTICPDAPGGDERICELEVKTRAAWKGQQWNDDVPDDVLAQVQWQLHVSGLDHAHVACLVGGQRLVEHRVEPEQPLTDWIIDQAETLWQHVLDGTPPPVDPSAALTDFLNRLFTDREGAVELDPADVSRLRGQYQDAHVRERVAKADKDDARNALVALLGPADTVTVAGMVAATYKPTMRVTTDLARLKAEHPDAYAACVTRKPTRPVLRWKD